MLAILKTTFIIVSLYVAFTHALKGDVQSFFGLLVAALFMSLSLYGQLNNKKKL